MSETFDTQSPQPGAGLGEPVSGPTTGPATLEQTSHPFVDRTGERLTAGRDWARGQGLRAQEHIRAHPLRTAAYAMGAGVLAGMLLKGVRQPRS